MASLSRCLARLFDTLFINQCQSCGAELYHRAALCCACLDKWAEEKDILCPFCGKCALECPCGSLPVLSLVFYNSPLYPQLTRRLIFSFKQNCERVSSDFFARELASVLSRRFALSGIDIHGFTIVFPPRAKSAAARYGFDQCAVLAKSVARLTGAKYDKVFRRCGNVIQKQLDAAGRMENARTSYSLRKSAAVRGRRFILIDDVVTSGATVSVCTVLLKDAGAEEVFVASIAKTYPMYNNRTGC